jgi:hypothetical protein
MRLPLGICESFSLQKPNPNIDLLGRTGYFMAHYNPETEEEIKECTDTMKNFFTYLLYHDVCPEHNDDLEEARKTCDRSAKELRLAQLLIHHDGPGDFNHGCSKLFGGYYFEDVDNVSAWKLIRYADTELFTSEKARKVVKFGIALATDDRTAKKFKVLADRDSIKAKQVEFIDGFEVISMEQPSAETVGYYQKLGPDLFPVGKVIAKEFRDPARGNFDLTPAEKIDWEAGFAPTYRFEFLVEPSLLAHMVPGMKIITSVFETNFGMHYFDEILFAMPSFYKFLYNDWMMEYKEPQPLNFIPDEEEVARRRAQDSVIQPPEPTPAEWTLHMLTRELEFPVGPNDNPMDAVMQQINCLESVGWDTQELKEFCGLERKRREEKESTTKDPITKKKKMAKKHLSTKEVSSNEEEQMAKGKQAASKEQPSLPSVEKLSKLSLEDSTTEEEQMAKGKQAASDEQPDKSTVEKLSKLSLEDSTTKKGEMAKSKQAASNEQPSNPSVEKSNKVSLDFLFEKRDTIKPVLTPEIIKAFRDQKLEELAKKKESSSQFLHETPNQRLDRLKENFHNPKRMKMNLSPEFKEAFRKSHKPPPERSPDVPDWDLAHYRAERENIHESMKLRPNRWRQQLHLRSMSGGVRFLALPKKKQTKRRILKRKFERHRDHSE